MSSNKSNEILLLKKSKRGIARIIFGRTGIVVTLLIKIINIVLATVDINLLANFLHQYYY